MASLASHAACGWTACTCERLTHNPVIEGAQVRRRSMRAQSGLPLEPRRRTASPRRASGRRRAWWLSATSSHPPVNPRPRASPTSGYRRSRLRPSRTAASVSPHYRRCGRARGSKVPTAAARNDPNKESHGRRRRSFGFRRPAPHTCARTTGTPSYQAARWAPCHVAQRSGGSYPTETTEAA